MRVRFVGGSLGGLERDLPADTGPSYSVPVSLARPTTYTAPLPPGPFPLLYGVDEYRYETRDRDGTRVYRWVRPDIEGMRAEIARLKARVAELETPPPRKGLMRFGRKKGERVEHD